jgi:hypothetical protein
MEKIKHFIKKILHRTDFSGLTVFGHGQQFDWEILLTFFLLVIIIPIYFSIHIFLGVRAGDIFKDDYKAPVHDETIDRNVLDQVIKDFSTRAENLKKLQTEKKPVFVDPSL